MGTSFRKGNLVVYLFGIHQPSFLQTQLTQRMLMDIAVTDSLPSTAISATDSRIAVIFLVSLCFRFLMLLTKPILRQFGTARM